MAERPKQRGAEFLQARSGGPLHLRSDAHHGRSRCGAIIGRSWWSAVDGDICQRCAPPSGTVRHA